jgi:hypothetical protein
MRNDLSKPKNIQHQEYQFFQLVARVAPASTMIWATTFADKEGVKITSKLISGVRVL